MVVAIGFGIGASMTTLTVLRALSADPIPQKSKQLYYVQLDPRKLLGNEPDAGPSDQQTLTDAKALLRAAKADRQAMMTGGEVAIEPLRTGIAPFFADARYTSADFFSMFDVPFIAGAPWTAEHDSQAARIAVISRELADKLFGATDVVGRTVRVEGTVLRIVGVIDTWQPAPHFYDLNTNNYGPWELIYLPFTTSRELKLRRAGTMNCWDESSDPEADGAPCEWIQFWVELHNAEQAGAYRDFLVHYSEDQLRAGRFARPPNVRLSTVMEWLEHKNVVPPDARLQTWVALGFLLVCLINTIGLLFTKFLRRATEIGVRRALGASKRSIFVQLLVEAGAIGVVGAALGLALAWLGLWAVRQQSTSYASLAALDLPMLIATIALSIITSLLAGLLPAWRGCQVAPAIQLKSQ